MGVLFRQRSSNVERNEVQKLRIRHFGELGFSPALGIQKRVGERFFAGDEFVDPLLDRPATDKFMNENISFLANAEGAIGGLVLNRWVPPTVEVDDMAGGGESESRAARLE